MTTLAGRGEDGAVIVAPPPAQKPGGGGRPGGDGGGAFPQGIILPPGIQPFVPQVFSSVSIGGGTFPGGGTIPAGAGFKLYNVADYDPAAPAGAVNSAPAEQRAADDAAAAGGGIVFYPPGFYFRLSSLVLGPQHQTVLFWGSGRNATHIVIGATGVTAFQIAGAGAGVRCRWRDMWIGSFNAWASSGGIQAIGAGTPISELVCEQVTFQNLTNPVKLDTVHQSSFRDIRILQSIAASVLGVAMHVIRSESIVIDELVAFATAGAFGSDILRVDSDTDTIIMSNFNLANLGDAVATAGIRFRNSVGGASTGPRLCRATNCYVEHAGGGGYVVEDGRDVRLEGCHAAVNGGAGFQVTGGDSITISNSLALQNQQHGIGVTGGTGVQLRGNTCSNNGQLADNTYNGIQVDAPGVNGILVQGNRCGDFIFALANRQRFGINVANAAVVGAQVVDNDVRGNVTGGINDVGTATYRRGNKFSLGAMRGRAVLAGGTILVNTAEVLAGDNVLLTKVLGGGAARGMLEVGAIVAATSFVINSMTAGAVLAADTSTVHWEICH